MSFIKKIFATLAGMGQEQAPDRTAAMEKFRQDRVKEENLARERQVANQEAIRQREQEKMSSGVDEVEIPLEEVEKDKTV